MVAEAAWMGRIGRIAPWRPDCAMEAAVGRGARRKPHVLVMQDLMMSAAQPSILWAPIFHVFWPMPPGHVFLFS